MVVITRRHAVCAVLAVVLLLNTVAVSALGRGEPESVGARAVSEPRVEADEFIVPLLFVFDYAGEHAGSATVEMIRDSAAAAIAAQRPSAQLLIDERGRHEPRRHALARNAVGWIKLSVHEGPTDNRVRIAGYAVTATQPVFELSYDTPLGLTGHRLVKAWTPAADAFDRSYDELVGIALADVRFEEMAIGAVPGTHIHGLTDTPLLVPETGELRLQLPAPLIYSLEARARLHYPVKQLVLLRETTLELQLEQRPRSAYSWDLGLSEASYPSVEVSRRIAGDYAFIRGGFTSYLLGVSPFAGDDRGPAEEDGKIFFSEDMTAFNLQLGSYLHSPYNRFRAYVATGALKRLIHTRHYLGGDPVAPWGLLCTVGVENRPSRRLRFFLEWRPSLYRTEYPEILMRQLPGAVDLQRTHGSSDEDFVVIADAEPSWILSTTSFRLGLRWQH